MLVRAAQTEWRKSSMIAVDAGAHLASIIHILEREMPPTSEQIPPKGYSQLLEKGPFAGINFPCISAKANALYIFRDILHAFLITHPHLDHLSAMAINTPALEYGREAKAIVALPSTIEAIKNHIFNDWLWPNLSDEGYGVGFVTYRRLIEGGNPRLGSGDSRGYVNVCDGLATKCWSVSHGRCHRRSHSVSHQHSDSFGWNQSDYNFPSRRLSRISDDHGYFAAVAQQQGPSQNPPAPTTPGLSGAPQPHFDPMFEPVSSSAFFIRNDTTGNELLIFGDIEPDSVSLSPRNHIVWDDAAGKIASDSLKAIFIECSYDDSVRNEDLYGHLCPRHLIAELTFLAHCVVHRRKQLNNEQAASPDDQLLDGQSQTKLLDASTSPLMTMRQPPTPSELKRKRKRATVNGDLQTTPELVPTNFDTAPSPSQPLPSGYVGNRAVSSSRRKTSHPRHASDTLAAPPPIAATPGGGRGRSVQFQPPTLPAGSSVNTAVGAMVSSLASVPREKLNEPLKGLTIHIIHVKDTLMDGPDPGDVIVGQCRALSEEAGLGCEFNVTSGGQSIWV